MILVSIVLETPLQAVCTTSVLNMAQMSEDVGVVSSVLWSVLCCPTCRSLVEVCHLLSFAGVRASCRAAWAELGPGLPSVVLSLCDCCDV